MNYFPTLHYELSAPQSWALQQAAACSQNQSNQEHTVRCGFHAKLRSSLAVLKLLLPTRRSCFLPIGLGQERFALKQDASIAARREIFAGRTNNYRTNSSMVKRTHISHRGTFSHRYRAGWSEQIKKNTATFQQNTLGIFSVYAMDVMQLAAWNIAKDHLFQRLNSTKLRNSNRAHEAEGEEVYSNRAVRICEQPEGNTKRDCFRLTIAESCEAVGIHLMKATRWRQRGQEVVNPENEGQ